MAHPREEVQATVDRYIAVRDEINAGKLTWAALAQFFTDDAVFIDPAWGRVEGIEEMKRTVFGDAMVGFEEWQFPTEFYAIDGDNVLVKWKQILPGKQDDGRPWEQSGASTLIYAGDGKFCYEEDLLNMVHVLDDMKASKCPVPAVAMPPRHPNRDFCATGVSLDQETIDYVAITRLQSAYADVVNRRAWAEFRDLFLADAPVRVDMVTKPAIDLTGPDALGTFIGGAIERFEFFEFVVLNAVVEIDGDTARGRVFMCELRQDRDGTGRFTRAFGLYRDAYRRVDGRWMFASRKYQSLARSGRGEVFAFPEEEW